ncbi:MAG: cell division protein ZapA [Burkholderiales bacterium]|nr:cell division protein ZapA [Burkholderiales bacterium]
MSTAERTVTLDVHLLGRDYKVACREAERSDLQEAVAYLDQRMREIRAASKTAGADRIVVMAALNIANELLRERKAPRAAAGAVDSVGVQQRLQSMHSAIDGILASHDKLF